LQMGDAADVTGHDQVRTVLGRLVQRSELLLA
jgi:hypothetical protein